jgi:hypothetical protein
MRNAARILGVAWMAIATIAGVAFFVRCAVTIQHPNLHGNGLVWSLVFLSILPGYLMYRWGRGLQPAPAKSVSSLGAKIPYDRATEAGHVMKIEEAPKNVG